ncbi:phosphoglycerate kinase [candidate division MSBL1 archaeon SCGC-AAA382A13]|uniref:Phosphoglycerate kinase n=1 Tax=candidate division MSBL1 archaeon SCGC-AAA382A13 TaxID=1698279 RepID=A0A133VEH9_9EURY|nr:phosphoglycerate kinase [candidate division MSBL1 archaeon SCGC-AAA382A13]
MEFNTLEDLDIQNKTIIVRVDINSPIDIETGEILDDARIQKCSETLTELSEKNAKTVVIAHQGRPGGEDFTTLERHAEKMSKILDIEVDYIDDLFGPAARKRISNLKPGNILLLENARFYSEEILNRPAEEQAKTHLVKKLSPLADAFVNDAFAAAHRSQPSLVGFGITLPVAAGRLMEKEIKELEKAKEPNHPCIYILGGAKVDDSLSLINHVLEKKIADKVLTGGLVGQVLLASTSVDLGKPNMEIIKEKGYKKEIKRGEELLSEYGEKIMLPQDFRVEKSDKKAKNISMEDLPSDYPVYDIGDKTVKDYKKEIKKAKTIVANGPLGVFEKSAFAKGTNKILRAIANSNAFTTIGGGHLVAAAKDQDITEKISHVSTGGGACLNFLSGEKLPVIEMLKESAK